jgi:hypothetical protein
MAPLPLPRGPLTAALFAALRTAPAAVEIALPGRIEEPLHDDDLQLALYVLYELHYRGFDEVDEGWEWEPSLLAVRRDLEAVFVDALEAELGPPAAPAGLRWEDTDVALRAIADADDGPSLSRFLETRGTLEHFHEFAMHRSAYQLKEADPHSWAIPRLSGGPKAALVEVQTDEFGGGRPERMHAKLFADAMDAMGLDSTYGRYLDQLPGITLATVNLMSFLGLHRARRGAIIGHLALFEMTSSIPNRRYANGLRRLGLEAATPFFDEHVEADAVHEAIASVDMAGGLVRDEPHLAGDVLWGARALVLVEARWAAHLLDAWAAERTSLRNVLAPAA